MGSWLEQFQAGGSNGGSWVDQFTQEAPAPVSAEQVLEQARQRQEAERERLKDAGAGVPVEGDLPPEPSWISQFVPKSFGEFAAPLRPAVEQNIRQAGKMEQVAPEVAKAGARGAAESPVGVSARMSLAGLADVGAGLASAGAAAQSRTADVNRELEQVLGKEVVEKYGEREPAINMGKIAEGLEQFGQLVTTPDEQRGIIETAQTDPTKLPKAVFASFFRNLPTLAASGAATVAGGPVGGIAFMGALEGGHQYRTLIQQGVEPEKARAAAAAVGAINAALEYLPIARVLHQVGGAQAIGMLKQGAIQAALEGGTEAAQEYVSAVSEWHETGERPENLVQRIAEAGIVGALLGGVAGAGTAKPRAVAEQEMKAEAEFQEAEREAAQRLAALGSLPGFTEHEEPIEPPRPAPDRFDLLNRELEKSRAEGRIPQPRTIPISETPPLESLRGMTDDERIAVGQRMEQALQATAQEDAISPQQFRVADLAIENFVLTGNPTELVSLSDWINPWQIAEQYQAEIQQQVDQFTHEGETHRLERDGRTLEVENTDRGFRIRIRTPDRGTVLDKPAASPTLEGAVGELMNRAARLPAPKPAPATEQTPPSEPAQPPPAQKAPVPKAEVATPPVSEEIAAPEPTESVEAPKSPETKPSEQPKVSPTAYVIEEAPTETPTEPAETTPQPSRTAAEAAPVAEAPAVEERKIPPERPTGSSGTSVTPRGTTFPFEYRLVEIDDLVTSHDEALRENPAFPQEFQNRQRTRKASEQQVRQIAKAPDFHRLAESRIGNTGAAIVGPDALVESGNARTIGTRIAYEEDEDARGYRSTLRSEAEKFGFTAEQVDSMSRPYLVKVRTEDVADRRQLVRELNESEVAALSPAEQAMTDAAQVTPEMLEGLRPSKSGEITRANSGDFIEAFLQKVVPESQRGQMSDAKGNLNPDGLRRIENAVLARAYGDIDVVSQIIESPDPKTKRIGKGMLMAAPTFAKMRQGVELGELHEELDVTPDLLAALKILHEIRNAGENPETVLAKRGIAEEFELSDMDRLVLGVLSGADSVISQFEDKRGWTPVHRSAKRIAQVLQRYAELVENRPTASSEGLFGTVELPSKIDLFSEAVQTYEPRQSLLDEGPTVEEASRGRLNAVQLNPMAPEGKLSMAVRKWMAPEGLMPKEAHERRTLARAQRAEIGKRIAYAVADYGKALRNSRLKKGQSPEDLVALADKAYKGDDDALRQLPDELRATVTKFRDLTDWATKEMLNSGMIEPGSQLEAALEENIGVYVRRTYRAHTEPDTWNYEYVRDNHPDIWGKAFTYVKSKLETTTKSGKPRKNPIEVTNEEVINYMMNLFDRGRLNPFKMLSDGDITSKDLSILMRRGDIAPEIRDLLGEHTDPATNFIHTLYAQANIIAAHGFLRDVRQMGIENGWLSEKQTPDHHFLLVPDTDRYSPLPPVYTTKEIAEEFQRVYDDDPVKNAIGRWYIHAQTVAKVSKTVLSLKTHIRNMLSNVPIMLANGNWAVLAPGRSGVKDALRTVMTDLRKAPNEELRSRSQHYTELGVTTQDVRANQLRALARDTERIIDEDGTIGMTRFGKLVSKAAEVYMAEDDIFKILSFEHELAQYEKVYPDMPRDQLEAKVAEIVRATMPTYSELGRAARKLRHLPVGNFPAFGWEILRTRMNAMTLGLDEIRHGGELMRDGDIEAGKRLRRIGAKRITSNLAVVLMGAKSLEAVSQWLFGVDDEDKEALIRFVPPWSQYTPKILTKIKNGRVVYNDLGYTDPFNYINKPLMAFIRHMDDPERAMKEATIEFFDPFLDTEFGVKLLAGVLFNRDLPDSPIEALFGDEARAQPVYDPKDPAKWLEIGNLIAETFGPTTIFDLRKIWFGVQGKKNRYGREYSPWVEGAALFTGQRAAKVDVQESLKFTSWRYQSRLAQDHRMYNEWANTSGTPDKTRIMRGFRNSNRSHAATMAEVWKDIQAARRLGVSDDDIKSSLKVKGGLAKYRINDLLERQAVKLYDPETDTRERFSGEIEEAKEKLLDELLDEYEDLGLSFYWE